jgi:hypothetical protein
MQLPPYEVLFFSTLVDVATGVADGVLQVIQQASARGARAPVGQAALLERVQPGERPPLCAPTVPQRLCPGQHRAGVLLVGPPVGGARPTLDDDGSAQGEQQDHPQGGSIPIHAPRECKRCSRCGGWLWAGSTENAVSPWRHG